MKTSSKIIGLLAVCLFCAFATPGVKADAWNQKTIFTFSAPVEIPGRVLPAGTYVFKLADTLSDRNIVQVYDKDENKVYGTFLVIADERQKPTDDSILLFKERASNAPQAVKAWFYPGDYYGHEFVYPKKMAVALANANNTAVPSIEDNVSADNGSLRQAHVKAQRPNQDETEVAEAFAAPPPSTTPAQNSTSQNSTYQNQNSTPAPAPQPAQAQPRQSQPTQSQNTQARPARTLPKTASSLPLIGVIGLFSLALAFGFRVLGSKAARQNSR